MRKILLVAASLLWSAAALSASPANTYCSSDSGVTWLPCAGTGGGGGGSTVLTPSASSTAGITPQEANAASSLVAKSSAGNWYSATVSVGATAVYLMAFNATSAPADGAVTPEWCAGPFPASNATSVQWGAASPAYFSTGITLVTSSTGCTTKTAAAVTTLTAQVQ